MDLAEIQNSVLMVFNRDLKSKVSLDEFISCISVHISYALLFCKSRVKPGYWWGMIGYEMTSYFEEQGDSEQRKLNRKLAVPLDYSSLYQVEIKTTWLLRLASLLLLPLNIINMSRLLVQLLMH